MNKKILFVSFLMLLLAMACAKKLQPTAEINKVWTTVSSADNSLPIARHEAAFIRVGKKMFLLGGRGIKPTSIFDIETQKWTKGTKPPIELHHFQPVVHNSKVYIIGALTGPYPSETPVPNIYIYDTKKDIWSKGGVIPATRLRGSTGNVIIGNMVYVSCGIIDGHRSGHQKGLDSYNIITAKWEVLPDAPRARDHFQAVTTNGKIYVLGGRQSMAPDKTFSETIGEVDVYDIKNRKWETLKEELPNQRAGSMSTVYHNEILVIGGESIRQGHAHNEVDALNITNHTWRVFPSLVRGRHGSGILNYKDVLYIASGSGNRGGSPELTTMEKY
ncbi:kelch repeat-containing protein [Flavobacterium sp. NG2]|uniref:Kelch repeat-containing protein n=1 Tax=Flavobacterium sp. NG2 TaxID=3097547 RepID=UPI002A829195|nr:kelch repeat-containing protein [Flavobacterium sp. NG2]WPR70399.1 kelch repeat-containing protein [Flavobacterium sp. NG2]